MKIYEAIATALKECGAGHLFGLMGDGNLRWDLSAYKGETVTVMIRYWTDVAVANPGYKVDNLLLVDGNPLENLKLFEDPEKNLLVIMKDGKIYKNTLK